MSEGGKGRSLQEQQRDQIKLNYRLDAKDSFQSETVNRDAVSHSSGRKTTNFSARTLRCCSGASMTAGELSYSKIPALIEMPLQDACRGVT